MWPTNLMGQLRIQAEMSYGDSSFIGYGLCFFTLTLLTIFFVFTYLKRVLYMAFLTMISPLVALTYPIDKINDGQAQAFNKWLKEYLFNLLIQPLHLLIYTILITSAFNLAGKNPLYALVAIGFLIPAEKLMRSFFGFEKASTPGTMAGAAVGAGLVNTGLQRLLHKAPSGRGGKNAINGANEEGSSAPARIGYKNNDVDLSNANNNDSTNHNNENDDGDSDNKDNENNPQQAMLDAYDDKYGTDEWDPQERDQMAREAYKNDGGKQYTDEEYRQILKESGHSDEEVAQIMEDNVKSDNSNSKETPEEDTENVDSTEPNDYSMLGVAGRKFYNSKAGTPVRKIAGAAGYIKRGAKNKVADIKNKAKDSVSNIKEQISNTPVGQKLGGAKNFVANSKEGKFVKSAVKGAGRAIKYTAKQGTKDAIRATRRTVGSAIAGAPNAIARTAAGVALGAVPAAIGVGAAIASGDPSNLLTYGGGAALTAGTIAASRTGINMSNTKSATQIARERAFYGDKYEEHIAERNMKNWKKDDKKRQELEKYLGTDKAKNLYKGGKIDEYLKNEVTDAKDIAALEKLQEKKKVSFNDALLYYDAHDKYGDITRQKTKDKEDIERGYINEFKARNNSQEEAEGKAKRITKMTHEFESMKKDLNKF